MHLKLLQITNCHWTLTAQPFTGVSLYFFHMAGRKSATAVFFLFVCVPVDVSCARRLTSDPCDPASQPEAHFLKADQLTVLINGYSESRIPLLRSIVAAYSNSPVVSFVAVLWGNPTTTAQTLAELERNLSSSFGGGGISLIRQPSSSLNARFLPRPWIRTRAVLICDDDVEVDPKSVEFAFRIWRSNPERMIGMFARSHGLDLARKEWIYTVHPNKYSIVLTKFMVVKTAYLRKYSCAGGAEMEAMRRMVEERANCEDILMNFVVAEKIRAGPVMVAAERVRDWGDARNEDGGGVTEAGLSSRRRKHRRRRGECIRDFHRVLGKMPLRYSYGKVVNSVGEQALCNKSGNLLPCDEW